MMPNPGLLGEEFWAIQAKIVYETQPADPNNLQEEECLRLNAIRMRLLLDEIVKAKSAGKHVLAADLACLYHDFVCDFRDLMILLVPDYNTARVFEERMAGMKITRPEDN